MNANRRAFLDTIAYSELGEELILLSDNGYNVIVGSTAAKPNLFTSYADHPRKFVTLYIKGKAVISSAAGRYQVLARYYDHYKHFLKLPDFSPASQDRIAMQLISECRALDDIDEGRIEDALHNCRSRWASLPGAGYNQHENDVDALMAAYSAAGGAIA